MKKLRVYVDTSVIGGCFDKEFLKTSNLLFSLFEKDMYIPIITETVIAEVENAPKEVKERLRKLNNVELAPITDEVRELAKKYITEKIITLKYADDALHIAAATITKADVLVSWNFKHIVNLKKIHEFNAVNMREGYSMLEIRTPSEVIYDK